MYARMEDLAEKVTKAQQGSDEPLEPDKPSGDKMIRWWCIVRVGLTAKTQKGAYKILDNAKRCADHNSGYKVFDADGNGVYEPKATESAVKVLFLGKVSISNLNIRKDSGTDYGRVKFCLVGVYTIVSGKGASVCVRLKSGIGCISLDLYEESLRIMVDGDYFSVSRLFG